MSLYESIADIYDEIFPLKKTRLSFVDSFLGKHNLTILDIGCASGELALALAKKGHHVSGIDLDRKMVELARRKAKKRNVKVEFFLKDMAKTGSDFSPGCFDAVLCFGNTLVHLESLEAIKKFLADIAKILKKGGLVLLQVVNYDRVLSRGVRELPLLESSGFLFRREYHYNRTEHRIDFRTYLTLKPGGRCVNHSEKLYPLTFGELKTALGEAGFFNSRFFGSENKAVYEKESPALIAAAKKVLTR